MTTMRSLGRFDVTGLHYFSVVAEERNFSRAAHRLHIAQPAISRRIKALEEDLGVQLFKRHARGVDLTEAGESLLRSAYALFRQIENLRETTVTSADVPRGMVSVGVVPTPGEYLIPRLTQQARALYPELKFRFVEGYSNDLHRMLLRHEINLAIIHMPAPHPDIAVDQLLLDHLCLVGPTGMLEARAYRFDEAATFPLILPESPNLLRLRIDEISEERNVRLNVRIGCDGFWLTKSMIRAGLGCTMVTFGSVVADRERGTLAVAPIYEPDVPWALSVAIRNEHRDKLALTVVKELIRTIMAELRLKDIWKEMPQVGD